MSNTTLEAIRKHRDTAMRIARGFAKKLPKSVLLEDIEQAALIGLFEWKRNHPDETDEGWTGGLKMRIRGSIIDELRAQDWSQRRARSEGKGPVILGFDDVGTPDDRAWEPSCEDASVIDRMIVDQEAAEALRAPMHQTDAKVIDMTVFRGMRFGDAAHRLGLSEPRVSQMHARAINTMHAYLTGDTEHLPRRGQGHGLNRATKRTIREHHANQANRAAHRTTGSGPGGHTPEPHPAGVRAGGLGSAADPDAARSVPPGSGIYEIGAAALAELRARHAEGSPPVIATLPEEGVDLCAELARYQSWMVDQALIRTNGNKQQAAKLLRINRTTLVEMLKRSTPLRPSAREESPPMKQEEPAGYQQIKANGLQTVPRAAIARLRAEGLSAKRIAGQLQCNPYLVERELRRLERAVGESQ